MDVVWRIPDEASPEILELVIRVVEDRTLASVEHALGPPPAEETLRIQVWQPIDFVLWHRLVAGQTVEEAEDLLGARLSRFWPVVAAPIDIFDPVVELPQRTLEPASMHGPGRTWKKEGELRPPHVVA